MDFGVQIENHLGFSYEAVLKVGGEAERLGFDGLFICDHLMGRTEELARQPCLDTWVTLGALASATRTMRLGTLVSAVGFRHPSILAKMATTLDNISGGRLRFAIGAGWNEPEYMAYGVPFPPTRVRMEQLREAIQIIRLMWTEDRPTFNGARFKIKEAWCSPKPLQKPRPKIWVGGGGEQKLLRIVGELADGWNAIGMDVDEYEHKAKILDSYCIEAGRNPHDIERSYYGSFLAAKNENEFREAFERYYGQFKRQDETMEAFIERMRSSRLIGTVDEVIEKIHKFAKLSVTYLIVYFPDKEQLKLMKLFAETIMPVFQSQSGMPRPSS